MEVFLSVQGAVFADGVFQHEVEERSRVVALLGVAIADSTGQGLIVPLDRYFSHAEKFFGVGRLHRFKLLVIREPFGNHPFGLTSRMEGSDDQAPLDKFLPECRRVSSEKKEPCQMTNSFAHQR